MDDAVDYCHATEDCDDIPNTPPIMLPMLTTSAPNKIVTTILIHLFFMNSIIDA
jgi:hypothetical protein